MATENSRRIPKENAATAEEIIEAVKLLSAIEFKRLEKFAQYRINGLGNAKQGREWSDLFQEAVNSFLDEDGRRWEKGKIGLVQALTGAMRSISSNWKSAYERSKEPKLESELITTSLTGSESNPLQNYAAPVLNAQERLELKETIEKIDEIVSKRELAGIIVLGLKDKMSHKEIQETFDINETKYNSELRWIRRNVRRVLKEKGNAE